MIESKQISKVYPDGTEALREVSFDISEGESCSIIGPSGCGKTTLLFIFSGILKPTSGKALIGGKEVMSPSKEVALILQDYGLFPWKTVFENVSLGLELRNKPLRGFQVNPYRVFGVVGVKPRHGAEPHIGKKERKEIVTSLLQDLGLKGFEDHYPKQLSGGMQQRIGFARALALNPKILLMDEPLSSLDALTRETLQNFLLSLWKNNGITMLLVTHNIEEAVFLGERIIVLSPRPGSVVTIMENHKVGDVNYRNTEDFFDKCRAVRRSIEGGAI
jgi:NitT/TauT family transport system ATP-binding protein